MAIRMVFVMVALVFGGLQIAAGQGSCSRTEITPQTVEDCVNAVRSNSAQYASDMCGAADSASALLRDSNLSQAAQGHSANMAATGEFGHRDFRGRVQRSGFQGGAVAENVARGQTSAYVVVAGWMCSGGHRNNLLNCRYDSVGTGVDCSTGSCYITQIYGCSSGNCCGGGGGTPPATNAGSDNNVQETPPQQGGESPSGGEPLRGRLFPASDTTTQGGDGSTGNRCFFRFFCRFR